MLTFVHNFTYGGDRSYHDQTRDIIRTWEQGNLPKQAVDLAFVDPPYNFGVKYAEDPTGDKLPTADYIKLCQRTVNIASRLVRRDGLLFWLCPSSHVEIMPRMLTSLFGPRLYTIIKQETFAQYQQKSLTNEYRFLFVHKNSNGDDPLLKGYTFNPNAIRIPSQRQEKYNDKRANPDGRVPGDVWKIRRLQGTSTDHVDWHPAQLPPELLERIILGWTNEGDTVLDMFAGSGNMGLVCQRHKRNSILIDGSATYCEKMRERLRLAGPKGAA